MQSCRFTCHWALIRSLVSGHWNAGPAGKLALTELMGVQKLLLEQAPGSGGQDGFFFAAHGGDGLVVISDFNFEGTRSNGNRAAIGR